MNPYLFVLAAVCAVNAPRSSSALPDPPGLRLRVAAYGPALTLALLVPVAALARPMIDGLDLAPATVRLATGLVLAVTGLVALVRRPPAPEPALSGLGAAIVPVAFPTLLTPSFALLAVSASVDLSAPAALAGTALALASLPAVAVVRRPGGQPRSDRVLSGLGRLLAGLLVLAGLGLLMNGLFDI